MPGVNASTASSEIKQEVLKLMQQKDRIENEIKELTSILTKNGVGMNEPLVDAEQFPLSNVDVYQVRHARHRIICLQNDHKEIMKQIDVGLQQYFGSTASEGRSQQKPQDVEMHHEAVIHKTPFAKVTLVSPGSPAEYCGMQANDLVVEFGSVNSTNFRSMADIASVVQHSEGQQVGMKLLRSERYIVTYLIPKRWSGRGLLGCNIEPYTP